MQYIKIMYVFENGIIIHLDQISCRSRIVGKSALNILVIYEKVIVTYF